MRVGMLVSLAALLAVVVLAAHVGAREAPVDPDKEAIQAIIREYLLENPEIIEEAMQELRVKQEREQRAREQVAIKENRAGLVSHAMSPVSGNPAGDVTLVKFFDYQCGYCKLSLKAVMEVQADDERLRIAWKELPILGPVSRFAARTSLAAEKQGRYLDFHQAVMGAPGKLSEDRVMEIADRLGLDIERLHQDMEDPAIEAYLRETNRLAGEIGITGTPAFVIGDKLVPGAIGAEDLRQLIAEARNSF